MKDERRSWSELFGVSKLLVSNSESTIPHPLIYEHGITNLAIHNIRRYVVIGHQDNHANSRLLIRLLCEDSFALSVYPLSQPTVE